MDFEYDCLIGNNIKRLREEKGLTQEQLAARLQTYGLDITRSGLSKIEIGQRHIYSYEIKAIKEIFNITYDEILI